MNRPLNVVAGRQGFQHVRRDEPADHDLRANGRDADHPAMSLFTGGSRATVPADSLEALNIHWTEPILLKDSKFLRAPGNITVVPDMPVFTRQPTLSRARVLEYVEMMRAGDDITPVQVTDIVPGGGLWHLNGLHRLTAARLLGRTVYADVWR